MEPGVNRLSSTSVINQLQDLVLKTTDVHELLDELVRFTAVVHVPDVGQDPRWPEYMALARREGIGSSLCVPLVLEGEAGAGLNLYSTTAHGFSGEDIDTVEAYALRASKALRMAVRISDLAEAKTRLIAAMDARTTIDLAVGAIMAQNRCNHDAALKIMNIAARTRNLTLRDIAESVITSISEDPKVRTHFDG